MNFVYLIHFSISLALMHLHMYCFNDILFICIDIFRGGTGTRFWQSIALPDITLTRPGISLKYGRIRVTCHDFFSISQLHTMLKGKAITWPAT